MDAASLTRHPYFSRAAASLAIPCPRITVARDARLSRSAMNMRAAGGRCCTVGTARQAKTHGAGRLGERPSVRGTGRKIRGTPRPPRYQRRAVCVNKIPTPLAVSILRDVPAALIFLPGMFLSFPLRLVCEQRRGMTPLQGYVAFGVFDTQGSAALHPGLSNHARSGLGTGNMPQRSFIFHTSSLILRTAFLIPHPSSFISHASVSSSSAYA